ncbi:M48 family metalloprotease [Leptolyngbya sp. 15MV]|nr:M48 family metalloprotease [Leptolyngbya sp. 15MV]
MMPILACFVMGWWSFARVERRLREAAIVRELDSGGPFHPIPTRWGYTLTSARHQLGLTVVPILAIAGWTELVAVLHPRLGLGASLAWTATPAALLGVLVILALMPAVLRRVWRTTALASGPLRDALTAMCRAHRVRVRDLLVWRTDGTLVNAAVIGLVPPIRYILLTDALLEHLPEQQVEAVLAHELGHVRRRHMIWLGLIGVGGMMFCASAMQLVLDAAMPHGDWSGGVTLGAVAASLAGAIVIFGVASRRFEWQADAFAVQHLSGHVPGSRGPAPAIRPEAVLAMTGALDAVAHLNHMPRSRFTFRHGSIAERQQRLMSLVDRPADRLRPDRDAAAVKLAGLALLAAAIVALWALPGPFSSSVVRSPSSSVRASSTRWVRSPSPWAISRMRSVIDRSDPTTLRVMRVIAARPTTMAMAEIALMVMIERDAAAVDRASMALLRWSSVSLI